MLSNLFMLPSSVNPNLFGGEQWRGARCRGTACWSADWESGEASPVWRSGGCAPEIVWNFTCKSVHFGAFLSSFV